MGEWSDTTADDARSWQAMTLEVLKVLEVHVVSTSSQCTYLEVLPKYWQSAAVMMTTGT